MGCSSRFSDDLNDVTTLYSGLNLNQDKTTKPQTVQIETFAKFPKIP
ncbi:hypothetical protein NEISICOT_00818 [Neisseria sicca ATCC 29256]|uniref:Uncharacterized protein n=1 Tax=Neisseria sicca ATCC 29256 TaxID=547045 RepID=C6M2S9_NEISI|nr:hypothetical protein NEISICOT_00818 [Neisseria sicca ATCC 29256]